MGTRTGSQQRGSRLTWSSILEEPILDHEHVGHTAEDSQDSAGNWAEYMSLLAPSGSEGRNAREDSADAFVSQAELESAIMLVINLQEEMDECTRNIQKAFEGLDNPHFTPGEEEIEMYQAWRDSEHWIETQEQLSENLANAQRRLSEIEQQVARQDRLVREAAVSPDPGSSCESVSRSRTEQRSLDDRPDQHRSPQTPVRQPEDIQIQNSSDESLDPPLASQSQPGVVESAPENEHLSCVICRDHLQVDTTLALECAHVFHSDCIGRWLERKNNCPICLREVSDYEPSDMIPSL